MPQPKTDEGSNRRSGGLSICLFDHSHDWPCRCLDLCRETGGIIIISFFGWLVIAQMNPENMTMNKFVLNVKALFMWLKRIIGIQNECRMFSPYHMHPKHVVLRLRTIPKLRLRKIHNDPITGFTEGNFNIHFSEVDSWVQNNS